jgi:DNA-binding winged helix-turn-helix (wHTH) protein
MPVLSFPPFQLDLAEERLWKDGKELRLQRKPMAILRFLVEHPRRLVTQDEIVAAVWGKVVMSENLLRTHVRNLRQVIGDGLIETVVGRGYRFLADVREVDDVANTTADGMPSEAAPLLVGRADELDALHAAYRSAAARRRGIVFIAGDAGLGKTTIVDAFLAQACPTGRAWAGRGASVEQYGSGEAYLPVLHAMAGLCKGRSGDRVIDVLGRHAPTWLVQMPDLVPAARVEELQRIVSMASQPRMLREIAEALEALSADRPVVLALDDLQWSDPSTAELLAFLGRRSEPARLLVVGTYRPAELPKTHPLQRVIGELEVHKQASTVTLRPLPRESLEDVFALRYSGHAFPKELEGIVFQLTGGNPLFVTTFLDDLEGRDLIGVKDGRWQLLTPLEDVGARRPDSIRRLIHIQLDRLPVPEQRLLEAASVAGDTFASGVLAPCLGLEADDADSLCESLANAHRFLRYLGTEPWPDGTIQTRYAFAHSLYRDAARARASSASLRAFHRAIAGRLQAGHPGKEEEVAAELAGHFDEARQPSEALGFHLLAGERAARVHGHVEAIGHFQRARTLLEGLPHGATRDELELRCLDGLGPSFFSVHATTSPELGPTLERTAELARTLKDDTRLGGALLGLQRLRMLEGQLRAIGEHAEELDGVASRLPDERLGQSATFLRASAAFFRARFEESHAEFARVSGPESTGGEAHPLRPIARAQMAVLAWVTGQVDTALSLAKGAVSTADSFRDPFVIVHALSNLALIHAWRGEASATLEAATRASDLAGEARVTFFGVRARVLAAWAHSQLGAEKGVVEALLAEPIDLAGVRRTLDAGVLAETHWRLHQRERALDAVDGALAHARDTDERVGEPELLRLRGELLNGDYAAEAMRLLEGAFELAGQQGSPSFALRAATSLCRARTGTRKRHALTELRRIVATFAEGAETGDLRAANALLAHGR